MANEKCTLLIRHMPSELAKGEKDDFLRHFGAIETIIMGNQGPMKHCAFATFSSEKNTKEALVRLHQLDILGHRLVAELAKSPVEKCHDDDDHFQKDKNKDNSLSVPQKVKNFEKSGQLLDDVCFNKWEMLYPRLPGLTYLYPPPTMTTLMNISNAMAAHPKFYVQVLHLMNKLNLPVPFSHGTPIPPMASETVTGNSHDPDNIISEEMEFSSTEESEIESSEEFSQSRNDHQGLQVKRKRKVKRKKIKLSNIQNALTLFNTENEGPMKTIHMISDIFEKTDQQLNKTITLQIPSQLHKEKEVVPDLMELMASSAEQGFGKILPEKLKEDQDDDKQEEKFDMNFISGETLRKGRITKEQMKAFSAFKSYNPGESTCRLYIKNLGKQTMPKDLHHIFGRYVDWSNASEENMFDIRLMTEGRMKGQAFITMPSESQASRALKDINGYVLNGKPIVVQFGRSAKPKDTESNK